MLTPGNPEPQLGTRATAAEPGIDAPEHRTPAVPPGYKQTEEGLIPVDWELKRWGEVITHCSSGATPYRGRPEYFKGSIRWITSAELDYGVIHDTVEHISEEAVRAANLRMHPAGTFLMAITGLEAAGTRGACGIVGTPSTTNQSCMAIYPTSDLSTDYLFHYYVYKGNELALRYCQGTKQQSYNARLVRILPIPLPPNLTEQTAIAAVLSDMDALIAGLEQAIAKQRLLKQGAMQELLTGKRRLPGFEGEWVVKALGELGATYGGLVGKVKADFGQGDAQYITFLNVMSNVVIDTYAFESVKVLPVETQNRVSKGDLFFNGSSETPEEVGMCAILLDEVADVYLNSFCFGFRLRDRQNADGLYLAYYFRSQSGRDLLRSLAQGATRYNLSKTALLKLEFPLPPLTEQTAIAAVLSDMDAAIAALEAKLAVNSRTSMYQGWSPNVYQRSSPKVYQAIRKNSCANDDDLGSVR